MAKPYIPPPISPPSYTWTWVGASLLLIAFVIVLALFPPVFGPLQEGYEAPQWLLFFGRFHPIAVHLPIGVLILSILIELACLRRSVEERWGDMALMTLFVASVGGVIAVVFGIFLAREGGYEGGAFILHQVLGISTAFGAIIALFLRLSAMSSGGTGLLNASRFFLFASMGVMSIGAHFGANMVHGSKYLTQYAPEQMATSMTSFEKWMLSLVEKKEEPKAVHVATPPTPPPGPAVSPEPPPSPAVAANTNTSQPPSPNANPSPNAAPNSNTSSGTSTDVAADKLVFQHVILPILEAKCNKCHNADKSKGDLRMDTYELAMKGGENGSNIVAGKPGESLAVQRIELPAEDDEHMPPDGKEQLATEELALIKWWIEQGASDKLKVSEAKFPTGVQMAVDAALKSVASHP